MRPLFLTCLCSQEDLLTLCKCHLRWTPARLSTNCLRQTTWNWTARRIISKAVLMIVGFDIQEEMGCLQLCGGQISGVEAAIRATRSVFESEECEAALLVDATNAFNVLNRVALHNIRHLYPSISTILINSYRSPINLFADGNVILLQECTTQGDPLAMPTYGLRTIPLIRRMNDLCKPVWYADDSTATGTIEQQHV